MDEVEDYESARQEQIRKNKALLESLGLNSQTTRMKSPSPPRVLKPPKARQPRTSRDNSDSTESRTSRSSLRRTSGPTTYNERELSKKGQSHRQSRVKKNDSPREGSRKSRRIANGGSGTRSGKYNEDSSDSNDDSRYGSSRAYPPRLKTLKNPTAPRKEDPEEEGQGSDRMEDEVDDKDAYWVSGVRVERQSRPLPTREELPDGMEGRGDLIFEDEYSHFRPNLTPEEVIRGGAFGGGFFRDHYSTVLHRQLNATDDISSLPQSWISGLDHTAYLSNPNYDPSLNRYQRKAGQSLHDWEKAGWIAKIDPRGWFEWYIKFYNGRRCSDDTRQISRWLKACGPGGRFKKSIVVAVYKTYGRDVNSEGWKDEDVSPVIRQVCWQWACELNQRDYIAYLPDQ
ncbi:unnamed protein product [Sympodiomycopsis kandeliae]